jgi:hypothetical protein
MPLDREEYIEQAYFFRVFRERLHQHIPSQDILASIHAEVLSTTKLPMAIDFLKGEIVFNGRISDGMARLAHYFAPFQAYVMHQAEEDRSKFDQFTALEVLEREAAYRADAAVPAGLFVYQFECLSRNKLGYDRGMLAMADDPLYDEHWAEWIRRCRLQLGTIEFADLIYYRSEQYLIEQRKLTRNPDLQPRQPVLFGAKEGRIARANAGKDPLFMFAALQRQLGYPAVPRPKRSTPEDRQSPAALEARIRQLEKRLQLLESEVKGDLDLSQFYVKPPDFTAEEFNLKMPPTDG